MPEILTESFCERCGTRYTFESAQPKGARLKGIKVVSRGLRNFVMSDETSMDEAMAAARNETDREATSQQLDAFHKTFNFCMSCRQYTCSNCWNEVEGRCLSCAPNLGNDVLPSPFPDLDASNGLPFGLTTPQIETTNGHAHPEPAAAEPMAWPTSDLMRAEEAEGITFDDVIARHEAEPVVDDDASFDPLARLAALDAVEVEPAPAPEADEAAAVAAEAALGEPFEAEGVAETEPIEAAPLAEPEPQPFAEPEPGPLARPEPEPVAATPAELPLATAEPGPEPAEDERAAAAAAQTTDLLNRFRPGQNLDDAIAAYERTQAAADALADEPMFAESEPQVVEAPAQAAEPLAAEPAPEPTWPTAPQEPPAPFRLPRVDAPGRVSPDVDRVAASAEPPAAWRPEADIEPAAEPVGAEARDDLVPQPTWQIMAPDTTGEPEWPAPPAWPGAQPTEGLPFLGRPAQPTGGIDALWAESAREVASAQPAAPAPGARAAGGVQPCVSCGLSLSANARFCRRCGTRQD